MTTLNASSLSRLWKRELQHHPGTGTRMVCLSIVVLTTVLFYSPDEASRPALEETSA